MSYHKSARSTRSSASHYYFTYFLFRDTTLYIRRSPFSRFLICKHVKNSLPLYVRQSQTYSSFRRHHKTHYFQSAFPAPSSPHNAPRADSFLGLWRYINNKSLTYLLTFVETVSNTKGCPLSTLVTDRLPHRQLRFLLYVITLLLFCVSY